MIRPNRRPRPTRSARPRPSGVIVRNVAAAAFLVVLVMALVPLAAGAPKAKTAKRAISAPGSVNVKSASLTSITLAWAAPVTTTRLRGYDVYRNGSRIKTSFRFTTTSSLSYTVSGLTCGRSYTLGVAAVSILGVRSPVSSLIASTSPCPDSQPPSAPTAIAQVAATTTSATVTWARSTDNFGVTGYAIYRDGVPMGQTAVTSYTLTGLLCGATYATAVDAFDAAGNRSGQSRYVVSTSACVDTDPPSQPGALSKAGGSATSLFAQLGRIVRQRRRRRLRRLEERHPGRLGRRNELRGDRSLLRNQLLHGGRCVRQGREQVGEAERHALDERLFWWHAELRHAGAVGAAGPADHRHDADVDHDGVERVDRQRRRERIRGLARQRQGHDDDGAELRLHRHRVWDNPHPRSRRLRRCRQPLRSRIRQRVGIDGGLLRRRLRHPRRPPTARRRRHRARRTSRGRPRRASRWRGRQPPTTSASRATGFIVARPRSARRRARTTASPASRAGRPTRSASTRTTPPAITPPRPA